MLIVSPPGMGINTRHWSGIVTDRCSFRAIALGSLILAGCSNSDRASVQGKLMRHDGSPLVGARIIATSPDIGKSAHAQTDAEGNYNLGGSKKGDGIYPGTYTLVIQESRGDTETRPPATISDRYQIPSTSGLSLVVEAGESKQLDLKLDPP